MEITTDYLIVGAGVMGMGFLDEMIRNSRQLEAVIVDIRDKPGGHWNDAYPFVRLHQPALTYGVNSRTLGVGGADLASKSQGWSSIDVTDLYLVSSGSISLVFLAPRRQCRTPAQILAHYEMALASLLATGRVRFLSQCKHVGDGVVVSLLEENVTYKVCFRVLLLLLIFFIDSFSGELQKEAG